MIGPRFHPGALRGKSRVLGRGRNFHKGAAQGKKCSYGQRTLFLREQFIQGFGPHDNLLFRSLDFMAHPALYISLYSLLLLIGHSQGFGLRGLLIPLSRNKPCPTAHSSLSSQTMLKALFTPRDPLELAPEQRQYAPEYRPYRSRAQYYTRIAEQNRRFFRALIDRDERVRASQTSSGLYAYTVPLPPQEFQEGATDVVVRTPIRVVPADSLDTAQQLVAEGKRNIVVLSMANATSPGGAYFMVQEHKKKLFVEEAHYTSQSLLNGNSILFPIMAQFTRQMY